MELERTKLALRRAEQDRNDLSVQLYGTEGLQMATAAAAGLQPALASQHGALHPVGSSHVSSVSYNRCSSPMHGACSSPDRLQQLQLGQQPAGGLLQHCSQLQLQLQQQDAELRSLKDQLLELQLQLADAHSAADIAQKQLQDTQDKLSATETAAAEASDVAAAANKAVLEQKQQISELQLQASEAAAARAQVERLEAQQRVLLGDLKEYMNTAAAASSAQAAAVAKADALERHLRDLRTRSDGSEAQWQQERRRLQEETAQVTAAKCYWLGLRQCTGMVKRKCCMHVYAAVAKL